MELPVPQVEIRRLLSSDILKSQIPHKSFFILIKILFVIFLFLRYLLFMRLKTFILQIRPPQKDSFTQILSIGIGGSALGPQFVAEALAPDNPPLKVFGNIVFIMVFVSSIE